MRRCLAMFVLCWIALPVRSAGETYPTKRVMIGAPQTVPFRPERAEIRPQNFWNGRQSRLEQHHKPTPIGPPPPNARTFSLFQGNPSTVPPTQLGNLVKVAQTHVFTDRENGGSTSTVSEPTVASAGDQILITANWFAAFSTNAGKSFTYLNPAQIFPATSDRPFCCDQVAIYDKNSDTMFWLLQYQDDGTSNLLRLAVAHGSDLGQSWRFYDLTPATLGGQNKEWFDFPDLAVTPDSLFLTTNVFRADGARGFSRAVIARIPVASLVQYQPFALDYLDPADLGSFRSTQGAQDVMYFATHVNTGRIRVLAWSKQDTALNSFEVDVAQWSDTERVSSGPDGREWMQRVDNRITAAWYANGKIGFAWSASRDDTYPKPHIRVAVVDPAVQKVIAEPHIWNPDFAFALPAAAPASTGETGIGLSFGGGLHFPGYAIGYISQDFKVMIASALEGTHGPADNKWGDFASVRNLSQSPKWITVGYCLRGGPTRESIQLQLLTFSPK